jgi:uncharacterized protein (UPF0548 family)
VPGRLSASVGETAALNALRGRAVNYDPALAPQDGRPAGHWHVDAQDTVLAREPPGPPVPGQAWDIACSLVGGYEFCEPRILRAIYRRGDGLLGRDMLLEGRFFGLRFYFGVRVTEVIDETREEAGAAERVWGWGYQTLEGHLEQGRLRYEVIKNLDDGRVIFRISGYSRRAPVANPVIRLGLRLFGRGTQLRFYRAAQRRLRDLVRAAQAGRPLPVPVARADGLVIAPSGATSRRPDRLARQYVHPGR